MALTPQRFIDALRDFGLLDPEDLIALDSKLSAAAPPIEMAALAGALIQSGKLTEYQAAVVSEGSAKSLVYGEYVVLDKLGAGGMGRVYKARHRRMKRLVALKVLPGEAMQDPAAVQRFGREVEAAAALHHPNIVTAFDAGEANGVHFLAMEYVEGRDLLAVARERGLLPLSDALDYVIQAARGLAYAHARGVIHRDIKPANLLLDLTGTIKVLDMGVARFTHPAGMSSREITVSGEMMGSADYMAPEQATDVRQADARADIYSLGYSLYRLLTGAIPYGGESFVVKVLAHREQPAPSLSARRPDVTAVLEAVYQTMVAKRPEDRFRDMGEVIIALEACRQALPPAAALPARPVVTSTPDAETLGPTMFARQQAISPGGDPDAGQTLVRIELDRAPAAGGAPNKPPGTRRRQSIPAIAGAAALFVAVVAGLAWLMKDRQAAPNPAPQIANGTTRAIPPIQGSGQPHNPPHGTLPANGTTAPFLPPTSSFAPPVPDHATADSRVAEWAIGLRGQVGVRPPASSAIPIWITSVPYLPSEDYRVTRVMVYQIKGSWVTDQDLERLRDLTELEDLNLGGCVERVTDRGMAVLGKIQGLSRLNLDGAGITDEGVARLRPLTDLSVLSLSSTGITDRGLESIRGMHRLERLYIQHTAVTDAVDLMAKACWPALWELALPDGAVTDRGLTSLAALQHLKSLLLSGAPISDDQLRLLADMKALRKLNLDSTPITDAGLANLEACPGLTSLSVHDTKITPGGIARLRKALPNCMVESGPGEGR
jgi:serine/threonine protein kinase